MVIFGLGNPGNEYANTHHNVGFMFVDVIANSFSTEFKFEKKFNAFVASFIVNNEKHYLVKPATYMNCSGIAVRSFMDYYKISKDEILVVYDDMDLPFSSIRIRKAGSAGGHNGMKSIIAHLNNSEFSRLRIGIGRPKTNDTIDFVLSKFTRSELDQLSGVLSIAPNICLDLINHGIDYLMNNYN